MNIEVPAIVNEKDGSDIVDRPSAVAECMQQVLSLESETDMYKEHFWVLGVNQSNGVLYIELVSLGTLTASLVHPREIFKTAILKNSARIIAVHNHPSGSLKLSEQDIEVTEALRKAGEILKIELLDHILITTDNFKSIRESLPYIFE